MNTCVKFRDNRIRNKKSVKPVKFDVDLVFDRKRSKHEFVQEMMLVNMYRNCYIYVSLSLFVLSLSLSLSLSFFFSLTLFFSLHVILFIWFILFYSFISANNYLLVKVVVCIIR